MPQVKHFAVAEFKEGVTPEQIETCIGELQGMVGQIPGLLKILHGPYDSHEGLNDGYTHDFIMTFVSPASLRRLSSSPRPRTRQRPPRRLPETICCV